MILKHRHVTFSEIDTTLDISGTSIHSILHEHLIVKKNLFALDSTQFVNPSKKCSCRLVERNAQKYDRGPSKHVYDIVTGDES